MMRARVASVEERSELWPQVISAYRPYASYRKRTTRDIPMVICEPRAPGAWRRTSSGVDGAHHIETSSRSSWWTTWRRQWP